MGLLNTGRNLIASRIAAYFAGSSTAWIAIGSDSGTAYNASQTDLIGASKHREPVDGAPGVATNIVTWIATVAGGDANFAWNEFGLADAASAGIMLNRLVSAQGTKGSGSVWQLTLQLTFAVG